MSPTKDPFKNLLLNIDFDEPADSLGVGEIRILRRHPFVEGSDYIFGYRRPLSCVLSPHVWYWGLSHAVHTGFLGLVS